MLGRRLLLGVIAATLAACAAPTATPAAPPLASAAPVLAPTGTLRVGVYLGSPTSLVRTADGQDRGVTVELGRRFAADLGVPVRQVEFARLALVLEALKQGEIDFTVTNATPARAKDMDFSEPVLALELGLLVGPRSTLMRVDAMDEPGRRIGVAQGSSSQGTLGARLKAATLVAATTLQAARAQLAAGEIDAFATNKGILFEMADGLPGARVLEGRWGTEHLAMAVPQGRRGGLPALRRFADRAREAGWVSDAAQRAGLRGFAAPAENPPVSR